MTTPLRVSLVDLQHVNQFALAPAVDKEKNKLCWVACAMMVARYHGRESEVRVPAIQNAIRMNQYAQPGLNLLVNKTLFQRVNEQEGRCSPPLKPKSLTIERLRQLLYWHGPLITVENNRHAIVLCYADQTRAGGFDPSKPSRPRFADNLYVLVFNKMRNLLANNTCFVYLPAPGMAGLGQCG